jgi:hypothetical protein
VPHDTPRLPDFVTWPTFPFEGDLRLRKLDPPVDREPERHGEDPEQCPTCRTSDEEYIWVANRWRVRALERPTGLPVVVILESRSHLDLGDLPNLLAAELGVMTVRLERAIRSLDGVARVHVNRWGDGSAHLHLWFLARPSGRLQLRGTFLSLWDDILPPIPEHQWRENLALVAAWLGDFGGRVIAVPPSMDWQSPSTLELAGGAPRADEDVVIDGPVPEPAASSPQGEPRAVAAPADSGSEDAAVEEVPTQRLPDGTPPPRTLPPDPGDPDEVWTTGL